MTPNKKRLDQLRERFGVANGQFFSEYRYKNLNWYLSTWSTPILFRHMEWFCYGDIRNEDISRIMGALEYQERLILGWKDLGPDEGSCAIPLDEDNRVKILISPRGVILDSREGWRKGEVFTLDQDGKAVWKPYGA